MGHPGPALLPVSDGGGGVAGRREARWPRGTVGNLGEQNESGGGERAGGQFCKHAKREEAGAQPDT